jgi:hypothetical protein
MGKSLSFREVVLATAKQKSDAAKARSSPNVAEKPKEVILAACDAIASDLRKDGFSFAKSGPKLKRVQDDLTFSIYFQSDRNNVAGRRAAIWIHAGVSSSQLATWRRSHPMPWGGDDGPGAGSVTGGQIGNLLAEPTWMEWDFANATRRSIEVDDAVSAIRRIILPFFALFDDPATAVDLLIHRSALRPSSLLQYAFVVLGREAAETAGKAYLKCNPAVRERFNTAFAEFSENGLPPYHTDLGSDLAAIALATNLDLGGAD